MVRRMLAIGKGKGERHGRVRERICLRVKKVRGMLLRKKRKDEKKRIRMCVRV